MHPAARVFTIALVIVLICSHLVVNVMTDKPKFVITRDITDKAVNFGGMEGVNDPVVDGETDEIGQGMKTITEGGPEGADGGDVKEPISVAVVGKDGDGAVDGVDRIDKDDSSSDA